MSQVKTAISIRDNLFKETDRIAHELDIPRSQVIAMALEEFVRRHRNNELLKQINEAYSSPTDIDEEENLEIIRSHQRRINRNEPW